MIPDDWTIGPLGDLIEYVTYGFTNPMPDSGEGPFKLTAKDVAGGRIVYETARRTTWGAYNNLLTRKSRPAKGDVLLTKDGSIGRVAVVDRDDVCINQSVAVMRPKPNTDTRFLSYLLQTPYYQGRMAADADGWTIKHIYITRVDKMLVAAPTSGEQRAIAAVLGSLDDKIEQNRRTGSKLEELARAVFKAWFVDFEPVKAKAAGATAFPGMPPRNLRRPPHRIHGLRTRPRAGRLGGGDVECRRKRIRRSSVDTRQVRRIRQVLSLWRERSHGTNNVGDTRRFRHCIRSCRGLLRIAALVA